MSQDRTSLSLLARLRDGSDDQSWHSLVNIYTPLLTKWLARHSVQDSDADDLVQEVLAVVVRELPGFEHNRRMGAFRSWLRTILVHRLRNFWRSKRYRPVPSGETDFLQQLDQLEDPHSELSQIWNRQHDRHLIQSLLARIEDKFTEPTRRAFHQVVIEGVDADEVASELNMTRNAVIIAKYRVLKELRRAGKGLLGD